MTDPAYTVGFEVAWATFPKRLGANPKRDAFKAWQARFREGITEQAMLDGTRRYLAFCSATQKIGTEYVMQGKRFFGPSHLFLETWDLPIGEPNGTHKRVDNSAPAQVARAYAERAAARARNGEAVDQDGENLRPPLDGKFRSV